MLTNPEALNIALEFLWPSLQLPFFQQLRSGAASFHPLVTGLVFPWPAPILSSPRAISCGLWVTKAAPITQEIPRVLGALCQELGTKTTYIFLFCHLRTALDRVPSLIPPQPAVPYLRTLLFCKTADAFLLYMLLCPLLTNHDSPCAANSPSSSFSGSKCRKNIVTFLRKLRDTHCLNVAKDCDYLQCLTEEQLSGRRWDPGLRVSQERVRPRHHLSCGIAG